MGNKLIPLANLSEKRRQRLAPIRAGWLVATVGKVHTPKFLQKYHLLLQDYKTINEGG